MDAFTDIGWFLYISLDSYKVWMHLQILVGFYTYLLILMDAFTDILLTVYSDDFKYEFT